ncbi:MAG: hypothetical protein PHD82_01610 [Candidatus Riflebacteria bacterium]|nr:hypothetical protein [Candidatus Riflebacteria bacterium]
MSIVKHNRLSALLLSLVMIFSLFVSPLAALSNTNSDELSSGRLRVSFSAAVDKSLRCAVAAMDKAVLHLCQSLDKTDNLNVTVHSHFYDASIRRYFVSLSGRAVFSGRLPFKPEKDSYLITGSQEVSFDILLSNIRQSRQGLNFDFNGTFVVSIDRLAYKMMQTVPHLAASGALGPAFDLMTAFFDKLNIGILSQAISETFRKFSNVALTKAGTELLSQAGKNKNLGNVIRDSVKNGSILNFLAITILKSATTSIVSVSGATLGAMVGSVIAPGPGTAIGGFLGSQILVIVSKAILHELTAELPLKLKIRKMVTSWRILNKNPSDEFARDAFDRSRTGIEKKIAAELAKESFSLFKTLLKEIDKMPAAERPAMIALLKGVQHILSFKITNEGDWYFARQYYQLKAAVERWGLQNQVVFTTSGAASTTGR